MTPDRQIKALLFAIVLLLAVIAARPYLQPPAAHAQSDDAFAVYVEPGVYMLRAPDGSRQVLGKIMVDLRNGNIWGFPTQSPDPYPSTLNTTAQPLASHPFLLGRYELADMERPAAAQ
ncbi:MAG TPA: hypothetical protein VF392_02525 [Terracidiphilus sp.]